MVWGVHRHDRWFDSRICDDAVYLVTTNVQSTIIIISPYTGRSIRRSLGVLAEHDADPVLLDLLHPPFRLLPSEGSANFTGGSGMNQKAISGRSDVRTRR